MRTENSRMVVESTGGNFIFNIRRKEKMKCIQLERQSTEGRRGSDARNQNRVLGGRTKKGGVREQRGRRGRRNRDESFLKLGPEGHIPG